ncbi:MAG TPA: DegT/DnrJ/EryC1/StrS family aminotransferase [bacterium]|uniref:L-glutamine:scyllo-inosose aminotransferase n=1 Tax=candidate division TA06 bacterium ADurb.Bin417 TaxID=1852828 RepID=A0A1V5MAU1_UNCT6|nr:MAG: L-glutamine:scyllo-inosose aminotransferase [candidate division TA06 bacterium ADurb.Bin417]HNQ35741.1 DegT/DnrJ/EryC1/StrS family aminotransferase [bacterium]HNS48580.1 DegT/DnrJ/EryC1/StrS family aminotransferase [bacterium]
MSKLALFGGPRAVSSDYREIFAWPIVNAEMESAVLEVLRNGNMSGSNLTRQFERAFADWHGRTYGLGCNNGTASLHCAMFGLKIGPGDEIICPSITYWASCLPVYSLGGTVVFADIDPKTLCLDPDDIEARISKHTKAILVVHYCGRPADMDRITAVARKHKLAVIEDVSHAHGALYKGRLVGTFGAAAGFSLMSGKSFAIGEAGIMLTDSQEVYERAAAFGFYERSGELTLPELKAGAGLPWGGYKYRMHQMSSAVGLVQLKKYPAEMAEIDRAMNYFFDRLEGTPGIRSFRPKGEPGSTMGGWYNPMVGYVPEELGGLSVTRFCQSLLAEGFKTSPGCNSALHLHPLFNTVDVYGHGRPTRIANSDRDLRQPPGTLPVSEGLQSRVFKAPWFKRFDTKAIDEIVTAIKKSAENYRELLADDPGNPEIMGGAGLTQLVR